MSLRYDPCPEPGCIQSVRFHRGDHRTNARGTTRVWPCGHEAKLIEHDDRFELQPPPD